MQSRKGREVWREDHLESRKALGRGATRRQVVKVNVPRTGGGRSVLCYVFLINQQFLLPSNILMMREIMLNHCFWEEQGGPSDEQYFVSHVSALAGAALDLFEAQIHCKTCSDVCP